MRRRGIGRRGAAGKLAKTVLCAAAVAGLAYAREVEPRRLVVERLELTLPRLAPEFDGYRVVQISDIHADRWMTPERVGRAVEAANALRPDLVALTGDFVTYSFLYSTAHHAPLLVGPLGELGAPDGVFAVLGNHDHRADAAAVRRALAVSGVLELANAATTLRRGSAALHLAGVDDPKEGHARLDPVLEELPEGGCAVLLAHEPDYAAAAASASGGRFDLQLSGHSHGGQVRIPPGRPLYLPPLSRRYHSGLYEVRSGSGSTPMKLYVSRGLGVAHLRLRSLCPPEVTLLTLRSPARRA